MRIRLRDLVIAGATAAIVSGLWLRVTPTPEPPAPASEEVPPYDPLRMADGHPALNGLWQALVTANWNLEDHEARAGLYPELIGAYGGEPAGQSVVVGGEIPYQPWALQRRLENFQNWATVDVSDTANFHAVGDPELKCYLPLGAVFRGGNPETFSIIERLTRVDDRTIHYEFTVADPETWTRPWTALVPWTNERQTEKRQIWTETPDGTRRMGG